MRKIMLNNTIDFYYFTGTGNTLLAVREVARVLRENGKEVNLYHLETADPTSINPQHTIGLAFPVAAFSTYPFVWRFIYNLPQAKNCSIFMLDTMAGFSGGIVGPLGKVLRNKGYQTIGAAEFIMPSNLGTIKSAAKNQCRINKSMPKITQYAYDLLAGKTKWRRIPILSDLVRLISKSKYPWRSMSKWIAIDTSQCIKCGLCAKLCPVKAIAMQDFPTKDNQRCEVCMRCISFCPANAVLYKGTTKKYRAVAAEDLL